mmetsp:Transcript_93612/g.286417  ORF Transcript_93612/g.286417 Transcript_93612/m.286417 type:complete len:223 (-) Transcript_93612:507-1175(-)
MRSKDKIAEAWAYSGATSSSVALAARCCAASRWMNCSTQDLSCCRDWLSNSPRRRQRAPRRRWMTSSRQSTMRPTPVCCAPFAGKAGKGRSGSSSSLPEAGAAALSNAERSLPRNAPLLIKASRSLFRSQASSTPARRLPARSRKRPDTEARSSTFCWTDMASSLSRWRASFFRCWCARQRSSRSPRCSAQARSTCASTRLPKSFAWWRSNCCSAELAAFSA